MIFFKKKKDILERAAYWIGMIFQALSWFLVLGLAVITSEHFDNRNRLLWGGALFGLLVVVPGIVIWYGFSRGKVADLDFTNRKERIPVVAAVMIFWTFALAFSWYFQAPAMVWSLLVAAVVTGWIFFCLTLFWKVSNHMTVAMASIMVINQLYNWQWEWLVWLVPVIAWARWYRRKHTIGQLLAGIFLGFVFWTVFVMA